MHVFSQILRYAAPLATIVMMLVFTSSTTGIAGTSSRKNLDHLKAMVVTNCIFHTYLIGIVAGKIGEESVSAGFKHAALLVVIAILAAKLMPTFIKL